jgi:hypothetical protein
VPPPRLHTVRYCGVLAPASKLRSRIVPKPAPAPVNDADADAETPKRGGSRYRPSAELLQRCFSIDVLSCPGCGGRMRLVALVTDPNRGGRSPACWTESTEDYGAKRSAVDPALPPGSGRIDRRAGAGARPWTPLLEEPRAAARGRRRRVRRVGRVGRPRKIVALTRPSAAGAGICLRRRDRLPARRAALRRNVERGPRTAWSARWGVDGFRPPSGLGEEIGLVSTSDAWRYSWNHRVKVLKRQKVEAA